MAQLTDTLINGNLRVTGDSFLKHADMLTGFTERTSSATWGTLTTGNGYTPLTGMRYRDGSNDPGDIFFAYKASSSPTTDARVYCQVDGYFYQNIGKYRCLDTSDVGSTVSAYGHNHDSTYLKLSGGTMSGVLTLKSGQYDDSITSSTSHALNLQNSNIIGINALYTADSADNAAEGIHFFRDSTHFDSLWASGGYLYFTPNRALGAQTGSADSRKVGILPASITTNQVVLTDGTNGSLKTLAASSLAAGSCEYPAGFANRNTGAAWGTHPNGTLITDWADGSGGDIAFWKNCPTNGQLSALVDGYYYQREGLYRCIDTSEVNLNSAAVIQYSSTTDTVDIKFN